MKQKRYWLRGLLAGIALFIFFVVCSIVIEHLNDGGTFGEQVGVVELLVIPFLSPLIPLGLIIGWIYGRLQRSTT
jgi:hypothetical protein